MKFSEIFVIKTFLQSYKNITWHTVAAVGIVEVSHILSLENQLCFSENVDFRDKIRILRRDFRKTKKKVFGENFSSQ